MSYEVEVTMTDEEAEALAACAIVGIEGAPDGIVANLAQSAVNKIQEALDAN